MDSGGLPICFDLSEGQRHDTVHAESLVEQLDEVNTIVCDKGYDSEPFRTFVKECGGETVIAKRNYGQDIDKDSKRLAKCTCSSFINMIMLFLNFN